MIHFFGFMNYHQFAITLPVKGIDDITGNYDAPGILRDNTLCSQYEITPP
jgi:hypothetical protein